MSVQFVEMKSGNPPVVERIGQVSYVGYRKLAQTHKGTPVFLLFPNGARVNFDSEDRCMVALASDVSQAWDVCLSDKRLLEKFGVVH